MTSPGKLIKIGAQLSILIGAALPVTSIAEPAYQTGRYQIDPANTQISFVLPLLSQVEGRLNGVQGQFDLTEDFTNSRVQATVPAASIETGIVELDQILRSPDLLDVEKFPFVTLESKSLRGTPENFQLTAAVTIKGVTKDVIFSGKYTASLWDSYLFYRVALQMTGKVNRKNFNINYGDIIGIGPVIGDEVILNIRTEGIREEGFL